MKEFWSVRMGRVTVFDWSLEEALAHLLRIKQYRKLLVSALEPRGSKAGIPLSVEIYCFKQHGVVHLVATSFPNKVETRCNRVVEGPFELVESKSLVSARLRAANKVGLRFAGVPPCGDCFPT